MVLNGFADSKVHGTNTGGTAILSAPDGPHIGPMKLAIRVIGKLIHAIHVCLLTFGEDLMFYLSVCSRMDTSHEICSWFVHEYLHTIVPVPVNQPMSYGYVNDMDPLSSSKTMQTNPCAYMFECSVMMTSPNEKIVRVTDLLCREFIGPRWIPLTKACDAEIWCFIWSAPR